MGLMRAARRRGLTVQAFKKGPDYIDPLWLRAAGSLPCYNLDPFVQDSDELLATYDNNARGKSLTLVEGTMGLHDGLASDGSDSNAAIAALLDIPVLLVVDCRGMHRTIAAIVNGLQLFDPRLRFAGVILNRVRSERHLQKITTALAEHSRVKVLGHLPDSPTVRVMERELGLVPAPDCNHADSSIDSVADALEQHCDLDALFAACQPASIRPSSVVSQCKAENQYRIALCKDAAFHFTYQDDLDELNRRGIELVELSPLTDSFPDDLHGLIIGGGFPERHAQALADNTAFREALNRAISNGLVVHAECGGLMYLCRSISYNGCCHPMVSSIAADVVMQKKPVGRGYVQLQRLVGKAPSVSAVSTNSTGLQAHEFHHSQITFDNPPEYEYSVKRGYGVDGEHDGVRFANVIASYSHFRHTRQTPWIDWFIERISRVESAKRPNSVAQQGRV